MQINKPIKYLPRVSQQQQQHHYLKHIHKHHIHIYGMTKTLSKNGSMHVKLGIKDLAAILKCD